MRWNFLEKRFEIREKFFEVLDRCVDWLPEIVVGIFLTLVSMVALANYEGEDKAEYIIEVHPHRQDGVKQWVSKEMPRFGSSGEISFKCVDGRDVVVYGTVSVSSRKKE